MRMPSVSRTRLRAPSQPTMYRAIISSRAPVSAFSTTAVTRSAFCSNETSRVR